MQDMQRFSFGKKGKLRRFSATDTSGEERCVTTLITAAKETISRSDGTFPSRALDFPKHGQ